MNQQDDLLNKFIDNEKKSKQSTLILVVVFIAIAVSIISMAYSLSEEKAKSHNLTIENNLIKHINDSLYHEMSKRFDESSKNLVQNNDTLKVKIAELTTQLTDVQDNIGKKITSDQKIEIRKNISSLIMSSNELVKDENSYIVYIQYNDKNNSEKAQIALVRSELEKNNYNVPREEYINRKFENTSVIYFYDDDKAIAESVLDKVRKIYGKAILQKSDLSAPRKQIEIWLNSRPDEKL